MKHSLLRMVLAACAALVLAGITMALLSRAEHPTVAVVD